MITFIVNPFAGKGNGQEVWNYVEKILTSKETPYQIAFTQYAGHARKIAEELTKENLQAIVAIGGDGTVHEVVNGMWKSGIPFGYIPAGTGNDFAISNQISKNPEQALSKILNAKPRKIDLLSFHEKVAVCNLGIGFDGEVAQVVTKSNWKKKLGKLAYALGVIRTVFRFKKTKIRIRIDDEWFQFPYAWLVAVCNLPTYGGGMRICPNAKVDDGKIDLACVSGISSWKLISLFPRVYRGSHATHSAVTLFSGRRVQIEADRKLLIHADGEIVGTTPIEISILPASLTILG